MSAPRPIYLRDLFAQKTWWRTSGGELVLIKDMDRQYRRNAGRYLIANADKYAARMAWVDLQMFGTAPDGFEKVLAEDERRTADPVGWITSTKLYRRLVKGLSSIDSQGADPEPSPHATVGRAGKLIVDEVAWPVYVQSVSTGNTHSDQWQVRSAGAPRTLREDQP